MLLAHKSVWVAWRLPVCKTLVGGVMTVISAACASRPTCFVELPGYNEFGAPITAEVASVTVGEDKTDLTKSVTKEHQVVVDRHRIYFDRSLIGGRPIDVGVKGQSGRQIIVSVALTACQQRNSVQFGRQDAGADVAWTNVTGALSGCKINGDWWVRATPMFGSQGQKAYEGYISPAGNFSIDVELGVRHLFVIGRAEEPIKTVAFNVVAGRRNIIDKIDVTKECPQM
jgi:hypothetical protein